MLINRPSFENYFAQRKYDEMALKPITFKGNKGEDEGPYHVSVNNRFFLDEYDIYYLYQFPPAYWTSAFMYRYNNALHAAKKSGKEYNDIQNVTIKRKNTVTFRNVNLFINHLIDKIERAVDVDHFRKSSGTPEDAEKYRKDAEEHKKAGRDLGGLFGASLENPIHLPGEKGTRDKDGQWLTKGFMGFNREAATSILIGKKGKAGWLPSSTQGWLDNLDNYSTGRHRPNLSGGKGKRSDMYAVFTGSSLQEMQQKMKAAGAKPFKIINAKKGEVSWGDVEISNGNSKTTSNNFLGSNKASVEKLPVLFPGKAIDSASVRKHESLHNLYQKIDNIDEGDLEEMKSNVDQEIEHLKQEITRKDLNKSWETSNPKDSTERENMVERLEHLKQLSDIKKWFKQKNIVDITSMDISEHGEDLKRYLAAKMKKHTLESKKYDAYEWNFHKHNRSTNPHDPLNVGMDNPVILGSSKQLRLKDKTRGFGAFSPNHQSKDMLHGPESGHWENNFKSYFGAGVDKKLSHYLNRDDVEKIDQELDVYLGKVRKKVASDSEVSNYLKTDSKTIFNMLSNPDSILKAIADVGGPTSVDKGQIIDPENSIPNALKLAYKEIKMSYKEINVLRDEVDSGTQSSSAIRNGVLNAISHINYSSDLMNALKENKDIIIFNAEKFIRRTTGEAAFANFLDSQKVGGVEKHKKALDLKRFIEDKAAMYLNTIAQLDFGLGTRRLRKERPISADAEKAGEGGGSYSADITADQQVSKFRGDYSDSDLDILSKDEPALIKLVKEILSSQNSEKSKFRTFRQASDSLSGTIGHSLDSVYSLIEKAKNRDQKNVEKFDTAINNNFGTKEKTQVTSDETEMLRKINAYTIYLQLCKAIVERDALKKGEKLSPQEFNLRARTKAKEMMAKAGISGTSNVKPEDIVAQTRERIYDPNSKLDSDEKMVAQYIHAWDTKDLNPFQINVELNGLEQKAKAGQISKRVVDLLLVWHKKPPVFGTLDDSSLAASDVNTVNRELSSQELEKINVAKANIERQAGALRTQQAAQPVAPVQPVTPIKPIDRSYKGGGGGLGGFRKPQPPQPNQ